MKKSFVLDTSVLLHNSGSLFSFADNEVVIPLDVLEELDRFKTQNSDLGRHAREVARHLDRLRARGSISEGVPLDETGGTLRVVIHPADVTTAGFTASTPDNRIIACAFELKAQGKTVTLVSKDINVRIKADAVGIKAMDFEKQKVNYDELYRGWTEVPAEGEMIDAFYREGGQPFEREDVYPNEFLLFRDRSNAKHTALGRFDAAKKKGVPLSSQDKTIYGIKARNLQQQMAFELLLEKSVQLVTLVGEAGTGKTLLALAAGLVETIKEKRYDKLLVARPIMPLGKDIGYLPGAKEEKLLQWMHPIFDNLKYLFHAQVTALPDAASGPRREGEEAPADRRIQKLIDSNLLELEALTYIRGRSIPRQYMIVDEAQNLTPLEVKTIVSRAGEGTKVVLTGDPTQIDNPYLDANSNGLSYAVERMKGQLIFGHVLLEKSERSLLASIAADLL